MKRILSIFLILTALLGICFHAVADTESLEDRDKIAAVQEKLKSTEYYFGDITGNLDASTVNAIRAFQYDNNIQQTGKLDDATITALELTEILFLPNCNEEASLKIGNCGENVSLLQDVLAENGFKSPYIIPSFFCEITASLVSAYQESAGLSSTGIADELTLSSLELHIPAEGIAQLQRIKKLVTRYYEENGALVILRPLSSSRSSQDTVILGDTGDDVVLIQKRLAALGYYTGSIDGIYGKGTKNAVTNFQFGNKLSNDGKCGVRTRAKLFSDSAVDRDTAEKKTSVADKLIAYAKTFLGTPYVYGANGPNAFDCTSYTKTVFAKFGISLARSAYSQGYNNYGTKISSISALLPGDLVFFNTIRDSDLSDHAGIYIGGGKFIHCSSSSSSMKVVISDLTTGFYNRTFSWARRVL